MVLAIFLVTARFVSQEDFGLMAICFLVADGFKQVFIESVGVAVIARPKVDPDDYSAGFIIMVAGSLLSAIAVFFLADTIATLFSMPGLKTPLKFISILIVTAGISKAYEAWLIRHFMFRELALRTIFSLIVGGAVGITLAIKGFGIIALVAQQLTTAIIGMIILRASSTWHPKLQHTNGRIEQIFWEAKNIGISRGFSFLNVQSDILFTSYYLGAAATGVYGAAKRILSALENIINAALSNVTLPLFAASRNDSEEVRRTFYSSVRFTSILTAPLFAGLYLTSSEIVEILLGPKWLQAAPVISILAANAYILSISMFNEQIMIVCGKSKWQSVLAACHAVTNVGLLILFARHGLVAVAGAYLIRNIIFLPVSTIIAARLIGLDIFRILTSLLPSIIAAGCMAAAVFFAAANIPVESPILRLLILIPCGVSAYLLSMLIFGKKQLQEAISLIKIILIK